MFDNDCNIDYDSYFNYLKKKKEKINKYKEMLKTATDEDEIELLENLIFDYENPIMTEREIRNDI